MLYLKKTFFDLIKIVVEKILYTLPCFSLKAPNLQKRQVTVFRDLDEYKRYQICFYRAR